MTKIAPLSVAGALLAFGLSAAPAQALGTRTFVSGTGTDSGACTRTAPCRTFAFALTQTAAGGEIDVLNTADYGVLTIDKSISIVNDGVGVAGIGASSGNAIEINAGANDSVHLRGLTIDGFGSGVAGIEFIAGGNLAIENCVIRNFGFAGIDISASASSSFSVSNSIASNNSQGIFVEPRGSAVVTGVLSKVITNNNYRGIFVDGEFTTGASLKVTIVDSQATHNSGDGVFAESSLGHATTDVILRNVVASYNGTGLREATAVITFADSVITGSNIGVYSFGGGAMVSFGGNVIEGNRDNNTSILTRFPKI